MEFQRKHLAYVMTEKKCLDRFDSKKIGDFGHGGKWYPHSKFKEYFVNFYKPSLQYKYSYLQRIYTTKFARWLIEFDPETALECGLLRNEDQLKANDIRNDLLNSFDEFMDEASVKPSTTGSKPLPMVW